MAYLLEIQQYERHYVIGTFEKEESIYKFIDSIPFVKKEISEGYVDYTIQFEDMPIYYEAKYNNYIYVITKYSFVPEDGDIYFTWTPIHYWDSEVSSEKSFIEGATVVDAYSFENSEVEDYVNKREELYNETKKYYENKGRKIERHALGSEDGEYVSFSRQPKKYKDAGSILYLLDPIAVEIWEKTRDVEKFLVKLREKLYDLYKED